MGETTYTTLRKQFSPGDSHRITDPHPAVTLVYGEEALCKEAVALVLDQISPGVEKAFRCDEVDAAIESIADICERLNTYAMLSGGKTVVAMNPNVFGEGTGRVAAVKKAKQAFDDGKLDLASKRLLRILGSMDLRVEDMDAENRAATIGLIDPAEAAQRWMGTLFDYCLQNGLGIPDGGNSDAEFLSLALERGFPAGNRLIMVTENVDKRSRLYRSIKNDGMVVDCSLPKGDRQADRKAKEALLRQRFSEMIGEAGKRSAGGVFDAVIDRTGFDVRIFSGGIEKLIAYVGGRDQIEVDDVHLLLRRTRKDPLYEFTGAVAERNLGKSLETLQSLLDGDFEPLQLLAAIGNQIRKLLVIREFMDGPGAGLWQRGMPFNRFQSLVYPAIQGYDAELRESVKSWKGALAPGAELATGSPSRKSKAPKTLKFQTDELLIAKAKRHPYPVYQDIRRAERFSRAELIGIYQALAETDIRMKSTGQNPVRVLEMLIFQICPSGAG